MEPISKITNEKKDYLGFSWIFVVHVCFKKGLLILEQIFENLAIVGHQIERLREVKVKHIFGRDLDRRGQHRCPLLHRYCLNKVQKGILNRPWKFEKISPTLIEANESKKVFFTFSEF